jgi:hypothetical protein
MCKPADILLAVAPLGFTVIAIIHKVLSKTLRNYVPLIIMDM